MSKINLRSLRTHLIKIIDEEYNVDISNNVYVEDQHIVLKSDLCFDWFGEGIIIYLPKYDQNKKYTYVCQGNSSLFDHKVKLYIATKYHEVINQHFDRYIIDDCELNKDETSFVISSYLPRS